jgi:hypothetical protein
VPWLLPLLVTGEIFKFLFQLEAGAVNQILLDLHLISQPIGFELSPGWAYVTVLITNIWIGVPFFSHRRPGAASLLIRAVTSDSKGACAGEPISVHGS